MDKMLIIKNLKKHIKENNVFDTVELLKLVNRTVNQNFKYITDVVDGTKSLEAFCSDGGGDCEDYAYIKSLILDEVIFNHNLQLKTNLYICVAKGNVLHCILEVTDSENKYYLDNIYGDIDKMRHQELSIVYPKYAKTISDGLIKRYDKKKA